ncbi:MAG: RecX family transcriptional regulator [Candidatus Dojkabacteria bacterium]|jgi:regulatory protein|nr:RecX family transcriptional regulator [Candidatus Dojkabacteria bacterium]
MVVTKLQYTRNGLRVNVFLDEKYAFTVAESLITKYRIYQDKVIDGKKIERIKEDDVVTRYTERVKALLGRRPRSEGEIRDYLKRKLSSKKDAINLAEEVIKRLKERDYIDDLEFAKWWVESRIRFRPRGRLLLKRELKQKKVKSENIDKVFQEFDIGEAKEYKDALRLASRKMDRLDLSENRDRAKLYGYLSRKGYPSNIIKKVLSKLGNTAREFKF